MKTIEKIREITKSKQFNTNQALEQIECTANNGDSYCLFRNLSENAFQELLRSGFKLSKFIDPFGVELIKVEW